jgi:hypothetical protein
MSRYTRIVGLLLLLLAACVPAQVPDQLSATAGASLVITDDWVRGESFAAQIPGGWRVVTGEATQSQRVTLVAPDSQTTIELQAGEAVPPSDQAPPEAREVVRVGAGVVTATLRTPADQREAMQAVFAQVVASLNFPATP